MKKIIQNKIIINSYYYKQIPGMAGVRSRTSSILSRLKGLAGKVARRVLVEEKYFPPRSHRFTAVYSRDKEYL